MTASTDANALIERLEKLQAEADPKLFREQNFPGAAGGGSSSYAFADAKLIVEGTRALPELLGIIRSLTAERDALAAMLAVAREALYNTMKILELAIGDMRVHGDCQECQADADSYYTAVEFARAALAKIGEPG